MEKVILVDANDRPTGEAEKMEAHRDDAQLHRAFTVFLRNDAGKFLITRRSALKPLWPLWWDAACSSHQRPGETDVEACRRRLLFELDTTAQQLQYLFAYEYHIRYSEEWSEYEINHIVIGTLNENPRPHPDEVSEYKWISAQEIDAIVADPQQQFFAPWFPLAWVRLKHELKL